MNNEQNLVWIDLEMTGLDPERHAIVEIATIITDGQLNELAEGPTLVIHQPEEVLALMDEWVVTTHGKSGLIQKIHESTISTQEAEQETLYFIQQYCAKNRGILAGNSVWQDKFFLQRYMPRITNYLNYRIVDVTSVKEILYRWYPKDSRLDFKKIDTHRALSDIRESIEELRHYRKNFFV